MSATKNDTDKPDVSLIPEIAMNELAYALMLGENKYGRYNYCKGMKITRLIAAAIRHLNKINNGEDMDPESGHSHWGNVMACCTMALRQIELGTITDNRYKQGEIK